MENEIMYIKLDDIIPNRFQPREVFDEEALNKLADSIRQHGVLEPILVRPVSNKYEIIAGERRYKASVLAGLTKIPAIVRKMDDKESSIVAFIENEHRSDVSAIEEARTMDRILKNNDMTQEELAKELGVNQSTIANKLRLLNLPLEIQESLMRNEISERHARSLLSVKDEFKQIELLNKIKERKMTVRELDSEIKNMNENMNNFNEQNNSFDAFPGSNPMPGFGFNDESKRETFDPRDYLNSFDSNPLPPNDKPVNDIPMSHIPPLPDEPAGETGGGFMDFLNNYDMKNPLPEEPTPVEGPTPVAPDAISHIPPLPDEPAGETGGGFMDFLNNYDMKNPLPEESTNIDGPTPVAPDTISHIPPLPDEPAGDNDGGFMDFLNNYDMKNPLPNEPIMPEASPITSNMMDMPKDDGFMNFLNNYDMKNPLPNEPAIPEASPVTSNTMDMPKDDGFMNFLNNYDMKNPLPPIDATPINETPLPTEPVAPEAPKEFNSDIYRNFDTTSNNVALNDVTPPITSNFDNQYIENNANFVDVSKKEKISSVDEIINKLGTVVKEIKEKSIYKVDTEEINYDDIYQITIKIDKRDYQ